MGAIVPEMRQPPHLRTCTIFVPSFSRSLNVLTSRSQGMSHLKVMHFPSAPVVSITGLSRKAFCAALVSGVAPSSEVSKNTYPPKNPKYSICRVVQLLQFFPRQNLITVIRFLNLWTLFSECFYTSLTGNFTYPSSVNYELLGQIIEL
jgi:hypothetical protein